VELSKRAGKGEGNVSDDIDYTMLLGAVGGGLIIYAIASRFTKDARISAAIVLAVAAGRENGARRGTRRAAEDADLHAGLGPNRALHHRPQILLAEFFAGHRPVSFP